MSQKKYFTHEEKLAAARIRKNEQNARNRVKINAYARAARARRLGRPVRSYDVVHQIQEVSIRPPTELLMERDFRIELNDGRSFSSQIMGDPPRSYSARYYQQAWTNQQAFARG